MNTQELIAKAKKSAESVTGYRYNPNILESIINSGVVPEGAIVAVAGPQVIKYEARCAVCYKDGKETKRTPCTVEQVIVGYAVMASKL